MTTAWSSPGGLYVVPVEFKERFLAEFPDYRIRWSLKRQRWAIEQRCGRGALPPVSVDPHDDGMIRACDGYWLVMEFQPGDRMPCRARVERDQRCGGVMKVPMRKSAEAVCEVCRSKKRDGRQMAAYWPFDECLLEKLRHTDPLRGGIQRARADADSANQRLLAKYDDQLTDATHSIDYHDYRKLTGIAASSDLRPW